MAAPMLADASGRLARVEEHLKCTVCLGFAMRAVESSCCHQLFCHEHVQPNQCPCCRKEGVVYAPAHLARRLMGAMPALCPDGCSVTGLMISKLGEHAKECPAVQLACPAPTCTWRDARSGFAAHLAEAHAKTLCSRAHLLFRTRVFFDISIAGTAAGRIVFELYPDTPRTTENFRCLCTGEKGVGTKGKPLHYKGSKFSHITRGSFVLGGDITQGDGSGGESIYGSEFFEKDAPTDVRQHNRPYLLSMCYWRGGAAHQNHGSQFIVTTGQFPDGDGINQIFGEVVQGEGVVKAIEELASTGSAGSSVKLSSTQAVVVTNCGQLP